MGTSKGSHRPSTPLIFAHRARHAKADLIFSDTRVKDTGGCSRIPVHSGPSRPPLRVGSLHHSNPTSEDPNFTEWSEAIPEPLIHGSLRGHMADRPRRDRRHAAYATHVPPGRRAARQDHAARTIDPLQFEFAPGR